MAITCLYSCRFCKTVNEEVRVPARDDKVMDVIEWMKKVMAPRVEFAHRKHGCFSTTVDLKIPVPENSEFIGQELPHAN